MLARGDVRPALGFTSGRSRQAHNTHDPSSPASAGMKSGSRSHFRMCLGLDPTPHDGRSLGDAWRPDKTRTTGRSAARTVAKTGGTHVAPLIRVAPDRIR